MNKSLHHLFSELVIGQCTIPNRIVSTGHHTYLANDHPGEQLIAYHEARARGGAGLIVSEIVAVHETAGFSSDLLKAESRDAIPAYKQLTAAIHRHGTPLFAQLFHPGREILSSPTGMLPIAWAPSAVPNERFHIMPRPMSGELIRDIIEGFGRTAAVLTEAGFDGFEIVASHGYLPSQFLNPQTNLRTDEYGGDSERRLRFLRDVVQSIRKHCDGRVVGLRISADELDSTGLTETLVGDVCVALAPQLDYVSLTAGTSASLGASVHITPPMGVQNAYMAKPTAQLRQKLDIPVLLSGRVNQPQQAEQLLADGAADLIGMTRSLICDPQMPNKAKASNTSAIRACIACNQTCIGRAHKGLPISCIQFPESGRELQFENLAPVTRAKKIIVAGAGPAGMKAAATAAARGHKVTLFEADAQAGGQALMAAKLPGREEFGGIVANLKYELQAAGVELLTNTRFSPDLLHRHKPDALIVATGAQPYLPAIEGQDDQRVVSAWDILNGDCRAGASVLIADWRADWIGLGLAEKFASEGCSVTLCVNAAMAGESLQIYTRNHYVGRLHKLGVQVRTHLRVFGYLDGSAYFEDTLTGEAVEFEMVDTLVLALGHQPLIEFENNVDGIELHSVGDCVAARGAEEAVYEGLIIGNNI